MKMIFRRAAVGVAIVLGFFSGLPAMAQQPVSGNYAPGSFTGMKSAIVPPPGTFLLENATMFYHTRDFVDSSGNKLRTETSDVVVNRTIVGYVFDTDIFGADYMPAVIFPFTNQAFRPVPESEKGFQLGDIIFTPVTLGWHHDDQWHSMFSYSFWTPTGRFNAGQPNNTGKGLYSHKLQYAVTWMEPTDLPWSWTISARYEILQKQNDTDIRPGQVLYLEGGVGKELFSGFDLGLTGYFVTQTTKERGSAPGTDTSRYRFFGLGPELNWRPNFLPAGTTISLRVYGEFEARNTSEGVHSVIAIAIPL